MHCEEKDYKSAYSYFFEAYENYSQAGDERYVQCLKYMLLCKIMTNTVRSVGTSTWVLASNLYHYKVEDVQALLNGKLALKYATPEMEAMRAVAKAQENSSLKDFQAAMATYSKGTPSLFTCNLFQALKPLPFVDRLEGRQSY